MRYSSENNKETIVQKFLNSPLNKTFFNDFFRLCFQQSLGYLRYLKSCGYIFPVDDRTDQDPLKDLVIDILGDFFESRKEQLYYIIFDYYHRHGVNNFDKYDCKELYEMFKILLFGFIKKALGRIRKQQNPQIENLKRRFKDIIKPPAYQEIKGPDTKTVYICKSEFQKELRRDKPPMLMKQLLGIVEETFLKSANRRNWCDEMFKRFNDETDYQNFLKKHELLSTVIAVNIRFMEDEGFQPAGVPSQQKIMLNNAIDSAREDTIKRIKNEFIKGFIKQKRITEKESVFIITACDNYLLDYGNGCKTDSIPTYFREIMPDIASQEYQKRYKYVFDTIINKAVEDFKNRLRNNPTIRSFGNYLLNE